MRAAFIHTSVAWVIGVVFLLAAVAKSASLERFAEVVGTLPGVSQGYAVPLAYTLLAYEMVLASLLLVGRTRRIGYWTAIITLIIFTAFLGWRLRDPYAPSCECFGELLKAGNAHDAHVLAVIRNLALLMIGCVGLCDRRGMITRHAVMARARLGRFANPALPAPPPARKQGRAFTLVELLVVIGIAVVLVGLLLTVLTRARGAGQGAACAAQQREVAAAMLTRGAESGFMPLSGIVYLPAEAAAGEYGDLPRTLADAGRTRYVYERDADVIGGAFSPLEEQVVPLPYALIGVLGGDVATRGTAAFDGAAEWPAAVRRHASLRVFECPSEAVRSDGSAAAHAPVRSGERTTLWAMHTGEVGYVALRQNGGDYGFNGGLLGFHHDPLSRDIRRRGRLAGLRGASETLLLADAAMHLGLTGPVSGFEPRLPPAMTPERVTLADVVAATHRVASTTPFAPRHGDRGNIAFADGHVAGVAAAGDIGRVVLTGS